MENSFLQDSNGDKSNSRLIADVMIGAGLLMSTLFIIIGVFDPLVKLMEIATAIAVLYGSIAGSAMLFLFGQKKTEAKETADKDQITAKVDIVKEENK